MYSHGVVWIEGYRRVEYVIYILVSGGHVDRCVYKKSVLSMMTPSMNDAAKITIVGHCTLYLFVRGDLRV